MTQYYASPTGGGTGLTETSPFKISNFLSKPPQPGDVLDLLDGLYQGPENMIAITGRNGTGLNPITIRAHNDGAVLIDGQFARVPVSLSDASFWILNGFNAKNGTGEVLRMGEGASGNIARRLVLWDSLWNANNSVIGIHSGSVASPNLVEDCAAFGVARKVVNNTQGGNGCIMRRVFIEGHGTGDDGWWLLSTSYNAFDGLFENIIATANWRYSPHTFTRTSNGNDIGLGSNGGNYRTINTGGLMLPDASSASACVGTRFLASAVYLRADGIFHTNGNDGEGLGAAMVNFPGTVDCYTVRHILAYVDPGNDRYSRYRGFFLGPPQGIASGVGLSAQNLTSVRGAQGDHFAANWSIGGTSVGATISAVESPWTATTGANLCKRWVNGVVTGDPLWPWEMNERIKAATAAAGAYSGPCLGCVGGFLPRQPIDVMAEIEAHFGPIPSQCRGTVSPPAPPVTGSGILPPPTTGPHAYYNAYGTFGPNEFGFPAVGANYQDPVFGSSIRRLTNELDQHSSSEIYSKNGFYNATGTVMHHRRADGSHALINPVTGASVRENVTFNVDSSFSPVDPDVWYYFAHGTTELKQFSVGAGTGTTIKTFPGAIDKLGGSVDWIDRTGRYMVLKIGGFIRVWDRQTDTLYAGSIPGSFGGGGGWIGISPDGNYVITNTDAAGHADVHSFAINHATQTVSTSGVLCFTLGGGHADVVSASDGKTYLISFDQDSSGAVYAVDVTLPQTDANKAQQRSQNRLLVPLNITTDEGHMSGVSKGALQDWCFISVESGDDEFGDTIEGWRPFMQEILMVNVLTGEVRRLAHHRSRSTSANYFYQPKVSASWDGLIYAWQSNFGYQVLGYADIYAVSTGTSTAPSAPSLPVQTPTPPEDTTIPSPDVRDYQVEVYVNDVLERVEYVTTNRYVYTILMNKTDTPPNGSRTARFDVRARMRTGTLGEIATVTVTDPPTGMN